MNEEEKKAIQDSMELINELNKNKDSDFIGRVYYKNKPIEENLQILLNLIKKQERTIENAKEFIGIDEEMEKCCDLIDVNGIELLKILRGEKNEFIK